MNEVGLFNFRQAKLDRKRATLHQEQVRLDVARKELTSRWMNHLEEYGELKERIRKLDNELCEAAKKWVAVKERRWSDS